MHRPLALALAFGSLATACGGTPVTALHALSTPGGFYDAPFPDDARLSPDGTFDLAAFPRPNAAIRGYVDTIDRAITGAGPAAAILSRFDGPLDPSSLPADALASLQQNSGVALVDITPSSPGYGERAPVLATFHSDGNAYIGDNWLAARPVPGFPLRERTTYALLLTDSLRGADGGPVQPAPELTALLTDAPPADPALAAAHARYAPLRAYLASSPLNNDRRVVGAAVLTTQDATGLMRDLRDAVQARPVPAASDLRYYRDHDGLCAIYTGLFPSPNFQEGAPPYLSGGGAIHRGVDGKPAVVRDENLRFALSVPNGPMPDKGWPLILYAHGTGGDYLSFTGEGIDLRAARIEDEGGALLARAAVLSIDQVLHGPRDPTGSAPELTFFNLKNLVAARDNTLQGATDDFSLLRLASGFNVAAAPVTGRPIRFDLGHVYFVGHSQGGLTGPPFASLAPDLRAAVLSGAGAVLTLSLLNKREPVDILTLVESALGEPAAPDHPMLNLLQAYFERADPGNYARLFFREPPPGQARKSVYQSLGLVDHYTPVPNIIALALALGVQPAAPQLAPLPGLELTRLRFQDGPIAGNVAGQTTGVLREYPQKGKSDGHFVLFDQWQAREDWSRFIGTDIAHGVPTLR